MCQSESGQSTEKIPRHDTTTCVVADRWGNIIVATEDQHTRAERSRTRQGRLRIALTPTLVLKDGLPIVAISDMPDHATLNVLLNHTEFGLSAQQAVTAPRFYMNHQDSFNPDPDRNAAFVGRGELKVHAEIPEVIRNNLKGRGHLLEAFTTPIEHPVMIVIDQQTGLTHAAGDPKTNRHAGAAK